MGFQHKRTPGKQALATIVVVAMIAAAGATALGFLGRAL